MLGIPVTERLIHSVYTASKQYGMHWKRLRKLLITSGILCKNHVSERAHACLFDAAANAPLLERIAQSMALKEVETYLGVGRVHARLLYDRGFIKPFISGDEAGIGSHAFAKEDLDNFLSRLAHGAIPVETRAPPVYTIVAAARRTNRSAAEIISALLDNRLKWRGLLTSETGFGAILVNLDEIHDVLADPTSDAVTKSSIHRLIGASGPVVLDLIREGIFKPVIIRNPRNRCPTTAIPKEQIDKFNQKYVSLHVLARQIGKNPGRLKKELRDLGRAPAFGQKRVRASFYQRSKIEKLFAAPDSPPESPSHKPITPSRAGSLTGNRPRRL